MLPRLSETCTSHGTKGSPSYKHILRLRLHSKGSITSVQQAPEERFRVLQLCSRCRGSPPGLRSEPQPTQSQQTFRKDSFLSTLKMNIQTPPTLLQLAGESLLRDQASAITALEYLPAALFLPLFIQAYRRRIPEPLKAMVHAWPFTILPLGCVSHLSLDEVLKAVLDELDVLFAQEVRPRKWKLRVLDLRKTGDNFRRMWCGDSTQNCSLTGPVAVHSSSPNMEHPLAPLEVFLDLNFNERDGDEFLMYILQWAQQRERLVHLCCKTLRISEVPFQRVRKVLDGVQLDCIQEVEVNCTWDLPTLGTFALYLGRLDQMLRCLQTPLDKLSITNCQRLTHSDLTHLFQCPNLRQLKSLDLFGLSLADFSLEPLRALLEAVAPTLQDLRLGNCAMVDSQVEAILPALSRCHQLRDFTISENPLSMGTVKKLLRHTAVLPSLESVLSPIPLECYRTQGTVDTERLALFGDDLMGMLRELEHPNTICPGTKYCH
ncbi:PRAME family member 15-like [Myotis daubentonii]|uniref:PRAME family member 15-like n=1 Tax=Myotis daubentonii TaxID=98922 RepID=UPI002873EC60|nr:PRAME family member 15-like [Myotis daubentonii]